MENNIKILSEFLNIPIKDLELYFIKDLYNIQEFLIGRGTYNWDNNEVISITRVFYESDGEYFEFTKSPDEYNIKDGILNEDYSVTPSTNLSFTNIGGLYSQMEIWEDIQGLQNQLQVALNRYTLQAEDKYKVERILNLLNEVFNECCYALESMKASCEEEQFLIDSFIMSYKNFCLAMNEIVTNLGKDEEKIENSEVFKMPPKIPIEKLLTENVLFNSAYEMLDEVGFLASLVNRFNTKSVYSIIGSLSTLSLHEYLIMTEKAANMKEYYLLAHEVGLIKVLEDNGKNSGEIANFMVKLSKIGMDNKDKYNIESLGAYYTNRNNKNSPKYPFMNQASIDKFKKYKESIKKG